MLQRNGLVTVVEDGEEWVSSLFQLANVAKVCRFDAMLARDVCMHCIVSSTSREVLVQGLRGLLPLRELRMRVRTHVGSPIEIDYVLRTFGIDVSDILFPQNDPLIDNDAVTDSIEADIRERQRLDDEWRELEAPYREPTSPIALFPNSQDIIVGRNKAVAKTWSGNVTFRRLIDDNVHRYVEAQVSGTARARKTLIAVEIFCILQNQYKARFLAREETRWVVVDDVEARKKITQALRALARERGALLR